MTAAPSESVTLARIAQADLCAGCGLCAGISGGAVRMEVSSQGFLRPVQTGALSPQAEATIVATCPALGQTVEPGERAVDTLWGPYLEMRTGWAAAEDLRHEASSGGALSALLVHLLARGDVDGVLQTAADPERAWGNVTTISRTRAEVLAASGSRYAPSSPLADIETLLSGNERLAFVGKPCDVAAFRALSARDPRVDARFPLMISFFCAGVPSLRGAEAVVEALGVSPAAVAEFRYRGRGWPGRAAAVTDDGTERSMSYHDSWGRILSGHVQHRCKLCADGSGKASDIVCADAWETDAAGYPVFEERPGVSLIVARTEKGAALMEAAEEAGHLRTERFDAAMVKEMQPGQFSRRSALLARLAGYALTGWRVPRYRGLTLLAAARQAPPRALARNFLGAVRRGLLRRLKQSGGPG